MGFVRRLAGDLEKAGYDVWWDLTDLRGGDATANAAALDAVLKGTKNHYRDVALLNAGAALVVAGRAKDLKEGVALGTKSLDSGAAAAKLAQLVAVSRA